MRGLSTVAAFVVFLTAFAVVMFSVFYFYDVLRGESQRGVSAVQSAVVHDAPVRLVYDGSRCLLEGGPYIFYILTRGGVAVYEGPADACPGGTGLYRYIGVARSGDWATPTSTWGAPWQTRRRIGSLSSTRQWTPSPLGCT